MESTRIARGLTAGGCGCCSAPSCCAWLHSPWPSSTGWRWLPPFAAWQSGALPYPVLLASQLVLAAWMASAAAGVAAGRTVPRPALGRRVAAGGGALRRGDGAAPGPRPHRRPRPLVARRATPHGISPRAHDVPGRVRALSPPWTPDTHPRLPDAGGAAHRAAWVIYPATMTAAYGLFAALQAAGAPLVVSTYVPILATAALVTALERVLPYRRAWQPPGRGRHRPHLHGGRAAGAAAARQPAVHPGCWWSRRAPCTCRCSSCGRTPGRSGCRRC